MNTFTSSVGSQVPCSLQTAYKSFQLWRLLNIGNLLFLLFLFIFMTLSGQLRCQMLLQSLLQKLFSILKFNEAGAGIKPLCAHRSASNRNLRSFYFYSL